MEPIERPTGESRLRWYQKQAVENVWAYLRENKDGAPCVVLPTGSGKSWVIAELCRQVVEWGGRVCVLAHVKELLTQNADKIAQLLEDPSRVGLYSAGLKERTTDAPIVVAGIQSAYRNVEKLGEFKLIVVDEAHLIPPTGDGMYRTFLEKSKEISPQARLVGLTATPYRLGCGYICEESVVDEKERNAVDRLLTKVVYSASTADLIADGTLSAVVSKNAVKRPDFSGVHIKNGDFDEQEVEKVWGRSNVLELACEEIVRESKDRKKVVVFCNRVESAKQCAKYLMKYDPDHLAKVVDGETSPEERAAIVREFKSEEQTVDLIGDASKKMKYLCNVGVFTTGFDVPDVDVIAILRPTKSLALYQQIVGRGLRRAPNKVDCLVLDYGGNVERHGPIDVPRPETQEGLEKLEVSPWKECKQCRAIIARAYPQCPICGYEEPKPKREEIDPNSGLSSKATSKAVLSARCDSSSDQRERGVASRAVARDGSGAVAAEEFYVTSMRAEVWTKKDAAPDDPRTVKISYLPAGSWRHICEWICPEHTGFARRKFEKWWKPKSNAPCPSTAEVTVGLIESGAVATPLKLRSTKKEGEKFAELEWVQFNAPKTNDQLEEPSSFAPRCDVTSDQRERGETSATVVAGRLSQLATCGDCRSFSPNETDAEGWCVAKKTTKNIFDAPCNNFEEPYRLDDLPF